MRLMITGANGQLGKELHKSFGQHEVIAPDRNKLDITDNKKVQDFIGEIEPDLIIHSAALTDVDGCEVNPDKAYHVNALGTQNIVVACQRVGAELVYVSTDFVFNGQNNEPYKEFDKTDPLNIYGKSKLAGEQYVRDLLNNYYIIRTAWLFGGGQNFVDTMLRLAGEKDYLEVVDDQIGSPTYTEDLSRAIKAITSSGLYGTYHVSGNGECSWYEFAKKIFELKGTNDIEIAPIPSAKLNRTAQRPSYSVLENYVLERWGLYKMPDWEEALAKYLKS